MSEKKQIVKKNVKRVVSAGRRAVVAVAGEKTAAAIGRRLRSFYTGSRFAASKARVAYRDFSLDLQYKRNKAELLVGEKIRISILFQIPSFWPSIEKVWSILNEDERFDPVLILYDKEHGEKEQIKGAREFLINNEIPFTEAEAYDFDAERPHIMLYQTPYDDLHRPEWLRSDVMKRKGIRIAYIPYGIEYSASIHPSWILSTTQLKSKPWISFALSDRMIEDHKKYSKFGADFLVATGLPKFDSINNSSDYTINESIEERIDGRKVVFWQMHFPALNGDEFWPEPNILEYLGFMRKTHSYEDIFFLVRPHPKFFDTYYNKGFEKEVDEIKHLLKSTENMYWDDKPDYRPALFRADYVVGDRSALMIEAGALNIPVLYMTNYYHKEKMLDSVAPLFDSYYQGSESYDIERFIDLVIRKNVDYKKQEREAAAAMCIPYTDGNCSRRIVDCMADKMFSEMKKQK